MTSTAERVKKLRRNMEAKGLEALLITNPFNRRYITGFTGTAGYVVITADRSWLFVDFRYTTQASQQAAGFEVIEHGTSALGDIGDKLREFGVKQLGFEQHDVTYGAYLQYAEKIGEGIELVPADRMVERLRQIKDEEELQVMQQAVDIADAAFEHVLGMIRPGITEREIALELEFFMRKQGASGVSFDTIVASGVRSAMPHGVASGRKIGNNEFVTLDFGCVYNGYCSDMTRTVFVGTPSEKHKEIYRIVLEAQLAVLEGLRPGMTGQEGDALARDLIAKHGYGDRFGHGTGHSVGLEIHEGPRLSKTEKAVLESGMIETVEPGIYIPDFGGVRIEDMVVLTDSGCRIMTKSKKDLIIL